jgi:riboflavin-specific deaminase-like protein
VERLTPDHGPTTIAEQLDGFPPPVAADAERPYVFTNFAQTLDGHATISGRSGAIGTATDTAMLIGLRASADAVMVGAGTLRAERYGRLLPDRRARADRERRGLPPDPLAVIVSNRMQLPWEIELFSSGVGQVLIFTASTDQAPETATPVSVVRHPEAVDLPSALRYLRAQRGVRSLLCEGGPHLHATLLEDRLVDTLFVTLAAKLGGGEGPRIVEGLERGPLDLELSWLLREGEELYARYAVAG